MIGNINSNSIYLSPLLKEIPAYQKLVKELLMVFDKCQLKIEWLEGTKDIWARDYMPVKVAEGRYVSFLYEPWYLKGFETSRTNRYELPILEQLKVTYSDINLDGGNIELSDRFAIVTDRIYHENSNMSKKALKAALEKLLERELIVIKAYSKSEDMTGHIDGMLRLVDENTIITSALIGDYQYHKKDMNRLKQAYGFEIIEMPFFEDPYNKNKKVRLDDRISAKGIYVNYLEIGEVILFPVFEMEGFKQYDKEAIATITNAYPNYTIVPIVINEIAEKGGLMNCISWTK
ncbi:MAG: agmatine deiminase [Cyclobacteriaceae bacterium]|jgi:agmatine deiminase